MFNELKVIRRKFLRSHKLFIDAQNAVGEAMVSAWNDERRLSMLADCVPPSPIKKVLCDRLEVIRLDKAAQKK